MIANEHNVKKFGLVYFQAIVLFMVEYDNSFELWLSVMTLKKDVSFLFNAEIVVVCWKYTCWRSAILLRIVQEDVE